MKTTPWVKNTPEIITKGIDAIQGKYLKKIGESAIREISLPKANKLFVLVIKDFKTGILSSDDLADFGFKIFHGVAKHYPDSDLFQASLSASDLNFEMRTGGMRVLTCLKDVEKFYKKNK
jgi:hypothetical protein